MKNKTKKLILLLLLNIFFMPNVIGEEIKFEANSIELIDQEKRIIAKKNIKIFDGDEIIYADVMDYNKSKQIIKAKGNVRIENLKNDIEIFANRLTYFKKEEKIILNENIRINLEKKLTFKTEEVIYDKNKKKLLLILLQTFRIILGIKISSKKSKFLLKQKY